MIKKILLPGIAALLLATGAVSTPAHSETGNGLLQACETLERDIRISGNKIQLPARADVHKCWGYMGAQLIRVFTNYARTHPQELHQTAPMLVLTAMIQAFPCP
jgi:hypothetical protein